MRISRKTSIHIALYLCFLLTEIGLIIKGFYEKRPVTVSTNNALWAGFIGTGFFAYTAYHQRKFRYLSRQAILLSIWIPISMLSFFAPKINTLVIIMGVVFLAFASKNLRDALCSIPGNGDNTDSKINLKAE